MECKLQVGRPGPFSNQIHVFVDDGKHLREFVIIVHGTVGSRPFDPSKLAM